MDSGVCSSDSLHAWHTKPFLIFMPQMLAYDDEVGGRVKDIARTSNETWISE